MTLVVRTLLALLLAVGVTACGDGDDAGSSSGGDYCALVRAAKDSVGPRLPQGLGGDASPEDLKKVIDSYADTEIARTQQIVEAAPSAQVASDWKQVVRLQQNVVDGLRTLADQQDAWAGMSHQQRVAALVTALSGIRDGVDPTAPARIERQVRSDCGITLHLS